MKKTGSFYICDSTIVLLPSEEEQLKLLATNGMLVKRPLLVNDEMVLVGFKAAEWAEKLNI